MSTLEAVPPPEDPKIAALMEQFMGPGTTAWKALTVNGALTTSGDENVFNTRAVHATEMPAANGITTARSLARMYAATVGPVGGVRLVDDETIAAASAEAVNGPDAVLVFPSQFGMGFMRHGTLTPMLSAASFGHAGAGGSLGYADLDAKVGYGYVMNQMAGGIAGDPRTIALNEAVRACL